MASYLITGTSRGIGLKLTEILVAKPASEVSVVIAATRTETTALKQLAAKSTGRIEIISIDVTSEESVKQATSKVEQSLGGKGLDVLINNAGIMNYTPNGIETMSVAAYVVGSPRTSNQPVGIGPTLNRASPPTSLVPTSSLAPFFRS